MSNSAKPSWPDLTALPFTMFGTPSSAPPAANAATQPFVQGLVGGMDAVRSFWGGLPGGTAMPGFLVPTLDVEELDKRVSDLRAAESWLEVNLNMLRATIQGLEVQRHTIAAINSFSVMSDAAMPKTAPPLPKAMVNPVELFAKLWPMPQAPKPAAAEPVAEEASPAPPPAPVAAPVPKRVEAAAPAEAPPVEAKQEDEAPAEEVAEKPADDAQSPAGLMLANLAANNWLGFMQEQFTKVAQAALAGSSSSPAVDRDKGKPVGAAAKPAPARKARAKPAAKKAARRSRAPARKES